MSTVVHPGTVPRVVGCSGKRRAGYGAAAQGLQHALHLGSYQRGNLGGGPRHLGSVGGFGAGSNQLRFGGTTPPEHHPVFEITIAVPTRSGAVAWQEGQPGTDAAAGDFELVRRLHSA